MFLFSLLVTSTCELLFFFLFSFPSPDSGPWPLSAPRKQIFCHFQNKWLVTCVWWGKKCFLCHKCWPIFSKAVSIGLCSVCPCSLDLHRERSTFKSIWRDLRGQGYSGLVVHIGLCSKKWWISTANDARFVLKVILELPWIVKLLGCKSDWIDGNGEFRSVACTPSNCSELLFCALANQKQILLTLIYYAIIHQDHKEGVV